MKSIITRIEIYSKIKDTRAQVVKNKLVDRKLLRPENDIKIADIYTTDKQFTTTQIDKISLMLANPVSQKYLVTASSKPVLSNSEKFSFAIEIGYLPGVTDNIAATAKENIEDLLKQKFAPDESIYSSQLFFIYGDISEKNIQEIKNSLYNPLIQRAGIKNHSEYSASKGMDFIIPKVTLKNNPEVTQVNLNVSDEELTKIGKMGIENKDGTRRGPLALDLTFMKTIQSYFNKIGRNPTDIELESIAQTWSEHCKHTIFADPIDDLKNGLFKTYIKKATDLIRKSRSAFGGKNSKKDFCVSVFTDNSGGISFDDDYMVTHKVETHNSPSALDPFGGAITGIVGVNRDAIGFGMGAKPVANFYGYCFADPRKDIPLYKGKNKSQKMLSSRRIMEGVIAGVNSGGNQSGIPTPQGFIYFDERYRGKPLVFVGTVGLIPKQINNTLSHIKKAMPGDYIVMLGGRVGKDGIHGATFSSEAMDTGSPATAVQLGDPITQKKLSDAIVKEARDMLLYNSITDNGAGGLSCSVAEMAKESNGCLVDLEKVPLKYPNLEPWEIWISESQERMTLAVPPAKWKKFESLMKRRGVEASIIGKFTDTGNCVVKFKGKKIMDIDLDFLHDGLPQRSMITKKPEIRISKSEAKSNVQNKNEKNELNIENSNFDIVTNLEFRASNFKFNNSILQILSRLNIAGYEFISSQYDNIVQGNAVLGPLQGRGRVNADTSVIRPVLSSQKGVILSQALYPTYTEIDPYNMAASSIDTAIRNTVAAGADPDYLSLLDNFCWCSSNDPERLWQLKESARACFDYAIAYGTPFISGKDSMFNDFKGFDENDNPVHLSILPTLLISAFGVIPDINKVVSLDAKLPGDLVYILGETYDELSGSEYYIMQGRAGSGKIPSVNASKNYILYKSFYKIVQQDLVASAISINRGGLAVALSKKAIGANLGITININEIPCSLTDEETILFSESQGRILATVAPENKALFEKNLKGVPFAKIGVVTKEREVIVNDFKNKALINLNLDKITNTYRETFKNY